MIMELPYQLQSLRLSIITTSSWKDLTGETEWLLIHVLVTHNEIVEGSGFPLVFFDNPECLATFCTRKEPSHPFYIESSKGTCEGAYNKLWHFSLTPRVCTRRLAVDLTRLRPGYHFPEKIQGTGKKTNINRSCAVCFPAQKKILARTGEKRKKESSFQCSIFKVAFYIQDCFQLYHNVQDYVAAYVRKHTANNGNAKDDN